VDIYTYFAMSTPEEIYQVYSRDIFRQSKQVLTKFGPLAFFPGIDFSYFGNGFGRIIVYDDTNKKRRVSAI
jgi:hypothetical protein